MESPTSPRLAFGALLGTRSFKRSPGSTLEAPQWLEVDGADGDLDAIARGAQLVMVSASIASTTAAGVAAYNAFVLEAGSDKPPASEAPVASPPKRRTRR